ncbi:MAG: DUF5682 family protein [Fimbriiglobus sp.]
MLKDIDLILRDFTDLDAPVVFFPVRHHSPTAARLVRDAIDRLQPKAVLIEGPTDYNAQFHELQLPHRLPIAIYSYLVTQDAEAGEQRGGVYYPFCEHSPEWQALRYGHERGAAVRFIDMPWAEFMALEHVETMNRYADSADSQGEYVRGLCRQLGVESFNDVWDTLFEIDAKLELPDYLARCHRLCAMMRLLGDYPSASDVAREAYMASRIREAQAEFGGPVLVVIGGYHAVGLRELLQKPAVPTQPVEEEFIVERGIALTPFSFERLDSLTGYNSGMPNPGFYQQVWEVRRLGRGAIHHALTAQVAGVLRRKNQPISSADLIAAETTARALAAIRGHEEIWRTDWLDGLTAALIKDDTIPGQPHPILNEIHAILRGGQRGALADGTTLPPLIQDIQEQLKKHELRIDGASYSVELNLAVTGERDKSRLLHRLRVLMIPGFQLTSDARSGASLGEFEETWRISWSPDFDSNCIENSRYGVTLPEAATARLAELAQGAQRDAGLASRLLLDAALAGLERMSEELSDLVTHLIRTDSSFINVTAALQQALFLYRYDPVLGSAGRTDYAGLLWETFDRSLWLLESMGTIPNQQREVVEGIRAIIETFERCVEALNLDGDTVREVFRRVAADRGQSPLVRGATLGGLWVLQDTNGEEVTKHLQSYTDPDPLGDFLTGLFAVAREQAQRQPTLLKGVHDRLMAFTLDDFFAALPALRLAFTYFTPREKNGMARSLRKLLGLEDEAESAALTVDERSAVQAMRWEEQLAQTAKKYGIRGFE